MLSNFDKIVMVSRVEAAAATNKEVEMTRYRRSMVIKYRGYKCRIEWAAGLVEGDIVEIFEAAVNGNHSTEERLRACAVAGATIDIHFADYVLVAVNMDEAEGASYTYKATGSGNHSHLTRSEGWTTFLKRF